MSRPTVANKPTSLKLELRWLAAGEILCREGDAPGPMYVVCSGSVRVIRDDPFKPHQKVELALLGPGSVIGELAPILNTPRTATIEAAEATQVLEVPLAELSMLTRRQTGLSRVLAHALHERAGLGPEQLANIGARLGVGLSLDTVGVAETETQAAEGPALPAPDHETSVVYPKEVSCPACGARFSALVFRPHKDQPSQRSTDFHQVYRTPRNPYDYEIWVCPNDLYAALPADFDDLPAAHRAGVADAVATVVSTAFGGQRPEFNVDRSLALREQALHLALGVYRLRQALPLRLAAILHRLAWCARERGDTATEQQYLAEALAFYARGYEEMQGGAKEELRVQYLCGEVNLRMGRQADALQWCAQALRHSEIKSNPKWEQMLKEQWQLAREACADTPTEASAE